MEAATGIQAAAGINDALIDPILLRQPPSTPPRRPKAFERAPELTRDQKLEIRAVRRYAGFTHTKLLEAFREAIPHLTIDQVRGACDLSQPVTPRKAGRVGPKPKVTEAQKAQIRAFLEENTRHRLIPWRQLPYYLEGFEEVRDTAIIRAMRDMGYKREPRSKAIRLTAKHKQARLEWARAYEHYTTEDWSRICFSDETWATGASVYREWLTFHETEDPKAWAALRQRPDGWMF